MAAALSAAARARLAWSTLVLLPLLWLWPCVLGGNRLVPFDPAAFPPAALTLEPEALAAARAGANYDVTEVWPWLLPEMQLAQQEARQGRWPSWDPHARTGAPLHEVGVLGVLYPPHWLWLLGVEPVRALVWLTWISLALAGLFAFGLLRRLEVSPLGAWLGAAAYELSATMAANGYFWTRLPALAWLPALLLALLCLERHERLRPGPLAGAALAMALPWCAGFPPYATAGTLLGMLLALRLVLERLGREGSAAAKQLGLRFVLAFAIGALLAMPQVLPSLWFFGAEAARSAAPSLQMAAGARFEPYGLLGYLVPDAFGHPLGVAELPPSLNPLCYLWGNRVDAAGGAVQPNYNNTEYAVSVGAAGLVLAGYGALRGRARLRGFVLVTLVLLLGLALFLPPFRWLYHLPAVGNVAPMRWLSPATLLVCWLAALGFDRLRDLAPRRLARLAVAVLGLAALTAWGTSWPASWHATDPDWPAAPIAARFDIAAAAVDGHFHPAGTAPGLDRYAVAADHLAAAGLDAAFWLLLVGLALAACAALRGLRGGAVLLWLLPGLAVAQLGLHGAPRLAGQPLAHGTDTAVHAFLRRQAAAAADRGGFAIARGTRSRQIPIQLPPGQLMSPGIRDLHFYTHYDARSIEPLRAAVTAVLGPERGPAWCAENAGRGYLERALPDAALAHPLLDLLGVRYVLATEELQHAGTRVPPADLGFQPARGAFFVYERPRPLPRAFTVPRLVALPDDAAVLQAMADPDARFDAAAFVAGPPPAAAAGADSPRAVEFVRDEPGVVELDIAGGGQPWLVLTDTWLAGWTATIDGEPVAIGRCNHSQRLVALPDRACRVRFEHSPPLLPTGAFLFAVGALLLLVVARRSSARARRVETTA